MQGLLGPSPGPEVLVQWTWKPKSLYFKFPVNVDTTGMPTFRVITTLNKGWNEVAGIPNSFHGTSEAQSAAVRLGKKELRKR